MNIGNIVRYNGKFVDSILCNYKDINVEILNVRGNKLKCRPLTENGHFWFDINEVILVKE